MVMALLKEAKPMDCSEMEVRKKVIKKTQLNCVCACGKIITLSHGTGFTEMINYESLGYGGI